MKKGIIYSLLCTMVFAIGCKPNLKPIEVTKGSADFSSYVAIGNSLCAGYTDGGLSKEGQENSFPRMLAQQFKLANGGEFSTPFMNSIGGGNNGSDSTLLILVKDPATGSLAPIRNPTTATPLNDGATIVANGPYNHVGIPGMRAIDVLFQGYGSFNPFLGRMTSTPVTSSALSVALAKKATFFSYWLGSNDVLLWALDGGIGKVQTSIPAFSFPGELTFPAALQLATSIAIDSLIKSGAKAGVIANVPDVSSTPYFTTVPYNAVALTDTAKVNALNNAYAPFNALVPTQYKIVWALGQNALVIEDSTAPGFIRKATAEDYICLSASSVIRLGGGAVSPLQDRFVLDKAEAATATSYTNQYNTILSNIATAKGLAFVDANSYLKSFKNGLVYNGATLNAKFVEGGGFSLDGIHPTPRGYALIANEFLKAINSKYGSNLPMVDVLKYRAVPLP